MGGGAQNSPVLSLESQVQKWPISVLVEEVLQLLFLPTASREAQAAVHIMLLGTAVGRH